MVALVLAPVVLAVAVYKLPARVARAVTLLGQAGLLAWTVVLTVRAVRHGPFVESLGSDGTTPYVTLRADQSALTLVLLASVLFTAAIVYVLGETYADNTLLLLLLALQGMTSGIMLVDDIFTLFVLFEVATLVVVLLVMFRSDRRSLYDGLFYLVIQIVAMAFFLFGIAYLYRVFGILDVSGIGRMIEQGVPGDALVLPVAFLLTGLALKAGLFPLFSFVPRSYGTPGAPTVVLMLMSAALVNGALFWIARLGALVRPVLDLGGFLVVVGLVTGVTGALKALAQQDLRLMLAYSTVAQAGLVTIGLSAGTTAAFDGGVLHLLHHGLVKSVLFLAVGLVAATYGTARVGEIRGVARRLPWVSAAALVAVLGMVGAPLTGAGGSKDLITAGATGGAQVAAWTVNVGTMLVFVKFSTIFVGTPATPATAPTRAVRATPRVVVVALGVLALLSGLLAPQVAALVLGDDGTMPAGPDWAKVAVFLLVLAGALVLRRALLPYARRARGLVAGSLSLPQSIVALCAFFASVALAGTLAVS